MHVENANGIKAAAGAGEYAPAILGNPRQAPNAAGAIGQTAPGSGPAAQPS